MKGVKPLKRTFYRINSTLYWLGFFGQYKDRIENAAGCTNRGDMDGLAELFFKLWGTFTIWPRMRCVYSPLTF
ncbi:hypothetical protein D0N36_04955 [Hymenobacter lapidiphilus]|nr:hypothetical protein D0N36_04955 [Hymenobacter sp. CCM 8763]